MDDKQQAQQREYDDQGDRHRAPAPASLLIARLVPLRGRNWTDRTTGSRLRRQRIATGYRADGFSAAQPSSSFAGARGAGVWMPSGSFRMRLVQAVRAGGSTAAYGAAAFVGLVAKAASFPTSVDGRTAGVRYSALAKRAIVLVHDQPSLAVQVAIHFGTNLLPSLVGYDGFVSGLAESRGSLAGAHRATTLVLGEVAV